jgi:hypothetical protein
MLALGSLRTGAAAARSSARIAVRTHIIVPPSKDAEERLKLDKIASRVTKKHERSKEDNSTSQAELLFKEGQKRLESPEMEKRAEGLVKALKKESEKPPSKKGWEGKVNAYRSGDNKLGR